MTKKKALEELSAWSTFSLLMLCIGLGISCPVVFYRDIILETNAYRFWTEVTFWSFLSPFFVLTIGGLFCFICSWIVVDKIEKYEEKNQK